MGLYDDLEKVQGVPPAPAAPRAPAGMYEGLELVQAPGTPGAPPREASGLLESLQAGLQGSAPGLAWRRRLPDLAINPDTASWWERAAASFAHVGAELPLMIGGAAVGGPAGAAVAGPAGGILGAGFAMGVVPATIRQSLIEAYKAGEANTPVDWFNAVRDVAKQALIEGGVNAAAMGAGAAAKGALATARGASSETAKAIAYGTATPLTRAGAAASEATDLATQIATMVAVPAVIEQRMPKAQEFIDAAILIGGLKAAHITASRMMTTYQKTGRTPAEQVQDAQQNPELAAELARPEVDPTTLTTSGVPVKMDRLIAEAEFLARGGVPEAPNIRQLIKEIKAEGPLQGDMIQDIERIGAIYEKARMEPLSDPERAELGVLKARVAELEAKSREAAAAEPAVAAFTPDQTTEARRRAEERLAALESKDGALTDAERAERVFLKNARPEAIARHFGLEPEGIPRRITAEEREASAQKVHDDVLQQLRDVDQARRDAGLQPLGDDHALAVAALVRARVRTRAARMGMLPEEIYNERPLQIRDETAIEVAAAEAEIPPGAPTFVPPEVDLFGAPIAAPMVPRHLLEGMPVHQVPVASLKLSLEVPQFKKDANEKGVVQPLGGEPDPRGWAIQVWERLNGDLEVISGRHRWELWQRRGVEKIPAQIHREADGFTAKMAAILDAELNIRDEQGSVADYVQYFKDSELTKEAADERGLLARAKGKSAFAIARDGTDDLIAANRAGVLSDEAALAISAAAPGSDRLQALGIAMVNEGKSILMAVNTMKAVDMMAAERMAKGAQGDIFGFDDSAMQEAAAMAKKASSEQRRISEQISAVNGASKRPELARKMGVDVQDPDGIRKRITELKQEQELWDNWPLHPELVARLRGGANKPVTGREGELKQGPVPVSDWRDAPTDEAGYYKDSEVRELEYKPYVKDGVVTANSRMVPNMENFPPVGSWRIAEIRGLYGREIEQLVELPIVSLKLGELDARGRLDPTKAGDDARYAEWLKEGKRAPPIMVVQTESGQLNVTDGHRRALAAKHAGRQTIEAWVNYAVPIPNGGRINSDPTKPYIRTGMTYEMLTGEIPNPYLDRMPFSMAFDLKPETPAELDARNREAAAQAMRKVEREMPGKKVTADQADLFNTQGTLFQSAPPGPAERWYSALTRAVDAATMKAAPVQGWKDWLRGQQQKGVKAEEIKWSGLEEWLDLQQGRVTKEQVRDFVASNGVRVTEKELGAADSARRAAQEYEDLQAELAAMGYRAFGEPDPHTGEPVLMGIERNTDRYDVNPVEYDFVQREGAEALPPRVMEIGRRLASLEHELPTEEGSNTKFSQYTLPGAKEGTYRELLLTLPRYEENGLPPGYEVQRMANGEYTLVRPDGSGTILRGAGAADLSQAELASIARDQLRSMGVIERRKDFVSSHFDEPNILAHVRFNERTDADGKRVLFVEEFQSDWAQKGKKEGFAAGDHKAGDKFIVVRGGVPEEVTAIENTRENGVTTVERSNGDRFSVTRKEGVPQAPFVGKTEAWVGLALKRMIRYAAENGFDRVAWTTGEQQVSRYTSALRKAVDSIEWTKTPEGVQLVGYKGRAVDNPQERTRANAEVNRILEETEFFGFDDAADARRAILEHADWRNRWGDGLDNAERSTIETWRVATLQSRGGEARRKVVDTTEKEDALSDAIGKAMADRILQDPNQTGVIEGENIRIDDTGMAAFYDRIVPNVAKDVLKKLGGGKITETEIDQPSTSAEFPQFRELNEQQAETFQGAENFADGSKPMATSVRMMIDGREQAMDAVVSRDGLHMINEDGTLEILFPGDPLSVRHYAQWEAGQEQAMHLLKSAWLDPNKAFWDNATVIIGEANSIEPVSGTTTKQLAFDITPEMRAKALEGLPLFQKERGSYQIAEKLITTMQGADRSTVVHELGHDWLEEMKADAMRPDAPAQIKADWDILRKELAIGEDGTIERASHEQFARSIERYVMEGEAPSVGLRGVFERFKAWLLDIYRSVMNLNVEINPELKAVLDRMLATDQEIADARELGVPRAYVAEAKVQEARKIVPGFKAEQVSMEPYADELPKGPGEAPDSSHINYAYINSPLDVKLTMQRMAEIDQANIQRQRGGTAGVKSWAESNAEQAKYVNDVLGGNEDTLKILAPRDPDAPGPDVRLGILKKLAVGAAKDSARLRDVVLQKGHDATVREQLEYMGSIERARMIQAEFLGERASVARALNALKDVTEGSGEISRMLDAIGYGEAAAKTLFQEPRPSRTPAEEQAYLKARLDEIMLNYGGRTPLDIARLHKEIGTLKGTFKFAKEVTKATKWEMVVEGWKSALLSGPVTHTTNLFGTGAFMALRAPVDAVAALIGMARGASPGMGETDRASMSEAVARITGMLGGVQDGLRAAKATFDLQDPTGKTEAYRNAIPGRAGELVRIPLRLMGAEDALVSTMYRRSELKTLAIRQAFDENLNPLTREFADRVTQLTDNPTPEMAAAAEAAATRMTFNMPLGEKGVYLQLFVNKWNLQWMIPFIRTPINITKEVARMSAFAPLVGEWRADMAKGGVARDKALAEFVLGSGIMALTMAYAFAGNVTGGGGPDPGKNRGKAGVEQPYSLKVGDTWYEYARIQPTGTLMGMAADIAAAWDHMTPEEKDKVPRMLARAFANAVTNQTFLQGITNVINAMSDPTRFAPKFLQQLAGSMVPNVIGQPTAMADPVVREVNSAIEAIYARLPGFRETLLPKRDWLGDEVKTKERLGVVGPVRTMQVTDDKVRLEAAKLDISMAAPPKKTHIGKGTGKLGDVELTPEEQDKFERVGGEMAHQILTQIVNAPGYDNIPPIIKRRIFSQVLTASHKVAAVQALPPEKRQAYLQQITEKVVAELAPAPQ